MYDADLLAQELLERTKFFELALTSLKNDLERMLRKIEHANPAKPADKLRAQ